MKTFPKLTWGLLALSLTATQPLFAQDGRGGGDDGRDGRDENPQWEQLAEVTPGPGPGTQGPPLSDEELDLTCGAGGWLGTWLEDANGNPIDGTYEYYCLDEE